MKLAPIFAILLLLTSWASAQQQHEYIPDAQPGFIHIRTKNTSNWSEDRYFRCDKVTSVTLVTMTAEKGPQCQVRIVTQELDTTRSGPVVVTLPMQPKEEAELLMFEIMQAIRRKD